MADTALENPTSKFPKPPFKRQTQPWPGLAGRMEPRPDHGEKSYKGSGRLAGCKALITSGDSGMGRAAAIAYARENRRPPPFGRVLGPIGPAVLAAHAFAYRDG